jgi:predicted Rossmann-fold nucleotide-binding protein
MLEIDNRETLAKWLNGSENPPPAAIQDLDLRGDCEAILSRSFWGSLFLGCELESATAGHIVTTGGTVIPNDPGLLFSVHKARLYSVDELFADFDLNDPDGYHHSFDYRVYKQFLDQGKDTPISIRISLARRLHDHSITDALKGAIKGHKVVAVMGGHGMERSDPFYAKVARVSQQLTRDGFLMVSGGGPGAMEATHLGAYFATRTTSELEAAIKLMMPRPDGAEAGKEYDDPDWLHRAFRVREEFPLSTDDQEKCKSVGIPTWLYGHEPPAAFATHIAKYFANSVREDGLLAIAHYGVIFAPGSAGTTQEIFQDATQNHYGTAGCYSPMILFGTDHWTNVRPVWPLLSHVASGHRYGELAAITDDEEEIVQRIRSYEPDEYKV